MLFADFNIRDCCNEGLAVASFGVVTVEMWTHQGCCRGVDSYV